MIKQHLPHIDDLYFERGVSGIKDYIDHLQCIEYFFKQTDSDTGNIGLKVDGSLMLLFGRDPHTNSFFVSTKSGLSKGNPRRIHSREESNQYYSNNPELAKILGDIWDIMRIPCADMEGVVQSDVLWSNNQDKTIKHVNNLPTVQVTPNIITYVFPISHNKNGDTSITEGLIGLALHDHFTPTKGEGKHMILVDRTREPIQNIVDQLAEHNIFTLSGLIQPDNIETDKQSWIKLRYIKRRLYECIDRINSIQNPGDRWHAKRIGEKITQFHREQLKLGKDEYMLSVSPRHYATNFERWLYNHGMNPGADKRGFIRACIYAYSYMNRGKSIILNEFDTIENHHLPFITHIDGEVCRGEGFVHFMGDSHVKIVDKSVFTKNHIIKYSK